MTLDGVHYITEFSIAFGVYCVNVVEDVVKEFTFAISSPDYELFIYD